MKKDAFNIPNILSYIRIALVPVFAFYYLTANTKSDYIIAAAVVILSGLTDMLDGMIARKYQMITLLGKIIDPIADKLMQATVALCLALRYRTAFWLAVIFIIKELATAAVTYVMFRKKRRLDGSLWFGKAATAVFYLACIALVGLPALPQIAVDIMILTVTAFMVFAFVKYIPAIIHSKSFDEYKL